MYPIFTVKIFKVFNNFFGQWKGNNQKRGFYQNLNFNFQHLGIHLLAERRGTYQRAGSGNFFLAGVGSSQHFLAYLCGPPILAYFFPFFDQFFGSEEIFEVWAGSGYLKSGPGQATKNPMPKAHGPIFWSGLNSTQPQS